MITQSPCRMLLCLGLAGLPALTYSEEGRDTPVQLEEVQVVAERDASLTVPSLETARENLDRIPGGANVVDAEQAQESRSSTLQDSLGYSPGVFVQPRFGAEESRLSIRGSGLQRTFHLRGIKLLQDGVPVSQADGSGDFQAIDALAFNYIEVYRGANALAFGATTLGGAVNFVTPTGRDAPRWRLRLEGGSFDYWRPYASTAGSGTANDYFLALSGFLLNGFRHHSQQETYRLFGNWGHRFADNSENRTYVAAVRSFSELPGSLTKDELEDNPRLAAPGNVALDQQRDFDLFRLSDKFTYVFGDRRLDLGAFWTYKDLDHPIFQVIDQLSNDYGLSLFYTDQGAKFGRPNRLTVGFIPVIGFLDDNRFVNQNGKRGARTADNEDFAFNLDLFAENQHYLTPALVLVTGLQASLARREVDDHFQSDGDQSLDEYYRDLGPKLGVRYELTPRTQVFANISRSFEPPSFGELRGGVLAPDLDAQTAVTVEIGSRGGRGPVSWDVALYHARVKDELLSLNDSEGDPLGTVNADTTRHQGIELGLEVHWSRLRWRQAYLYNDFRFDDDPVYDDNRLAGIPRHFLRAELLYDNPRGWFAGPTVEWSPSRYPVDFANTLFADVYTIFGFKAGYRRPDSRIAAFVEARNLGDRDYIASTGVIGDAQGLDQRQFLPGDGRSFFAGLEWRHW